MSVNEKIYTLLILVEFLSICSMFVVAYYILKHWSNKMHGYLFGCSLAIIINNTGYFFEMIGRTKETAMLGTQFAYLGKPFIALLMLLFTADFCKVKIPIVVKRLLYILAIIITFAVMTSNYNNLYYTTVTFTQEGLFPHNIYGHGPLYFFYMGSLVIYQIFALVIIFMRYRQVRTSKEKNQLLGTALMSLVVMGALALFFTGVTKGYDSTSCAYTVCALIFVLFMVRYNVFEDIEIVRDYLVENVEEGIIAMEGDGKEIFFYNRIAADIFPELEDHRVQKVTDLKINPLTEKKIFINNKIYESNVKEVAENVGYERRYVVLINDVTETYKQTQSLKNAITQKTEDISRIQDTVIRGLADMVEARDGYTGAHIKNTQFYVKVIVDALVEEGYEDEEFSRSFGKMIVDAAPLHDIGKISVPDDILGKPGRLTEDEFETIKKHTIDGANIIDQTLTNVEEEEYLSVAHDIALYHHEKWDGSGYPIGLAEKEIPLSARIMAVADVYDALTSERSYKEAFSFEKAKNILLEGRYKHFDGHLVDVFLDKLEEGA